MTEARSPAVKHTEATSAGAPEAVIEVEQAADALSGEAGRERGQIAAPGRRAIGSMGSQATSRVTRNVLYNLIGQSALLLLAFVSVRFVFRHLGDDAFGLLMFATTVNGVLTSLLDLGLPATAVRVIAMHRQDDRYVVACLRTASSVYWAIFLILAITVWITVPMMMGSWVHLTSLPSERASDALRLLLVGGLSALPRSLYASVFRGLQRMEFNNLIDVATTALQQAGIVAILVAGGDLMAVTLWMLASFAFTMLTYVAAASRFLPFRALLPGWSGQAARDQWRFSANVSGYMVMATVFMQSDKLVVSKLLPLSAFGYYSVVWTAVWKVASLATAVSAAAFPALVESHGAGQRERMNAQYRKLQDLVCHASIIPIAALAFGALPAFTYLFSAGIAASMVVPVLLLSLAYYMHITLSMPLAVAGATGRPELIMKMNVIALFTFLPALIGLVVLFGLTGAGLAWLGYYGLAYGYLVPRVCRRCLGVSTLVWYSQIGRIILKVSVSYGIGWSLCFILHRSGEFAWTAAFVLSTGVFVGLSLLSAGRRDSVKVGWARMRRVELRR